LDRRLVQQTGAAVRVSRHTSGVGTAVESVRACLSNQLICAAIGPFFSLWMVWSMAGLFLFFKQCGHLLCSAADNHRCRQQRGRYVPVLFSVRIWVQWKQMQAKGV
jgi:hypothetical protein